jgi:hypothetical protein
MIHFDSRGLSLQSNSLCLGTTCRLDEDGSANPHVVLQDYSVDPLLHGSSSIVVDDVSLTHLPYEDPDKPQAASQAHHDAVEQEIEEAVMFAFDNKHRHTSWEKIKGEVGI